MKPKIKLILAEDHLIVREGIRKLLEEAGDFTIVAEVKSGREAVSQAARHHPDVVVMDIAMPLLNGLDACRQLLASDPTIRVLILSAHMDDAYVEGAIDAGATGFTLKQAPGQEVAHAIREVHAGRPFFNESILQRSRTLQTGLPDKEYPKKREHLSPREAEVLQLIAEGKANKETASELGISIKTVEKHRTNLMRKLNIHETAGLTRYAISAGIIESSVQRTKV